jgi:hypothetical protein
MIWGFFLSAALVLNCADEIGGLGDYRRALPPKALLTSTTGVPQAELEALIPFPSSIDGDVARLYNGRDLRVFGITDFEQSRIERLEIFGFDRAPVLLATIFLETKPFNRQPVHLWLDSEYLYTALHRGHPELLKWMINRGILKTESEKKLQEYDFVIEELIDEARKSIAEQNLPIPTWPSVFSRLLTGYEQERRKMWRDHFAIPKGTPPAHLSAKAKQYAVPNPPNREATTAQFDGWLAWDHSALAVLTYAPHSGFPGLKVALHPKLRNLYHPAFPRLDERIKLEKRFEMEWLRKEDLVYVELASSADLHVFGEYGGQVLVFESAADLPEGVEVYRIDRKTGDRLTEKPEKTPPRSYEP